MRPLKHQKTLFEAIHTGIIDTIGSDHAPHSLLEKEAPYGKAPSGFAGIETMLPLLLNAVHEGKISLSHIETLLHANPKKIFRYKPPRATVTVDLEKTMRVEEHNLYTKAKWSPYAGWTLKGWPVTMNFEGTVYDLTALI